MKGVAVKVLQNANPPPIRFILKDMACKTLTGTLAKVLTKVLYMTILVKVGNFMAHVASEVQLAFGSVLFGRLHPKADMSHFIRMQ